MTIPSVSLADGRGTIMHATVHEFVVEVHACDSEGVFFFFQAEDGIRDLTVTGVQTCALPIWTILREVERARGTGVTIDDLASRCGVTTRTIRRDLQALEEAGFPLYDDRSQIGRASCRERV